MVFDEKGKLDQLWKKAEWKSKKLYPLIASRTEVCARTNRTEKLKCQILADLASNFFFGPFILFIIKKKQQKHYLEILMKTNKHSNKAIPYGTYIIHDPDVIYKVRHRYSQLSTCTCSAEPYHAELLDLA